ncbi:DUF4911 domain-containing protein [Desulfitibacter alkalitolerans]|uniref:DUF4911 domain-containing protein n=1 Tax=Desulfitibacter alkalitolerans TaxID=264641 RepID=UPI000489A00F|nr:DUF4911 domain-containing protein [Desulfitibacter alkalitolerans]
MTLDREISILVQVAIRDIDLLNKIVEGHEGIALVTTEDAHHGYVRLHTAQSSKAYLLEILETFPREIKIIDITE